MDYLPPKYLQFLRDRNFEARKKLTHFLIYLLKPACKFIVLTYDASLKIDGTGAQVQRQFGIYSIAQILGCHFLWSPISDVTIHPLDPFQSDDKYKEYLRELNHTFQISSKLSEAESFKSEVSIGALGIPSIFGIVLLTFLFRGKVLVKVVEPYRIMEFFQDSYDLVLPQLINWSKKLTDNRNAVIAVHFRQGVGGKVVYPGQKISRELDLDHFISLIKKIKAESKQEITQIIVLTDAPTEALEFSPPIQQRNLWENTPNYNEGRLSVSKFDFHNLSELGIQIKIHSGGNPIEAINIMANANFLLMGRSSLSYIAGILNAEGQVYAAPNFWHKPLSRWVSLS